MEPKIRFKGFEGEWIETSLSNLSSNFKYGINAAAVSFDGENKYLRITDIDDTMHSFLQNDVTSPGTDLSCCDEYLMQDGDIVIARTGASVGKSYIYHPFDGKVYFAGFLIRMRLNENTNRDFVFQNTLTNAYAKHVQFVSQRSGQPGINVNELQAYKLRIPSLSEQQFIATYFRTLDNKIQSTSKKLASLKKLKSASLVAMFPQQGETTPKVRFKGFEGEWKTPSIGYVFELRNGYTPSKIVKEFWEGGTIPWFRMEDIRMNGGFLKDALQHITPWAVKGAGLFEKNSIILATTATIGVHAMLIADSQANQQFTNFKVRKSLSDEYIDEFIYYSFFKIDEWSKNNTNSGGLLSVNMPLLVKQSFLTPCKEEQQAIATFFRSLDRKIALETARLEKLKQIKLACLDIMFV